DQIIEGQPRLVPLAVAQPADSSRQALEADLVLSATQPLLQPVIFREELHDGSIGDRNVAWVTGKRPPAQRALARPEQRPDIGWHEAWKLKSPLVSAEPGLVADRVAVVENLRTGILELHHGLDIPRHAGPRPISELLGFLLRILCPVLDADALRQVGQRIVGAGLVSDDVDRYAAPQQLGEDLSAVPDDPDGPGHTLRFGGDRPRHSLVKIIGSLVKVAVLDPALEARSIDVDNQADAVVQRDGQGLGSAHPAATASEGQGAGERAAEPFLRDRGEGLVGTLHDALSADVDP